ncbi:MAG: chromosome segregation protein SMC, partial [Gammaproteobacteria bacterium]
RGDAMTDVIFNGSSARKPVGQASVELVFDNSDGSLSGEYARYNELSIRRVVTREGQSTYYLNGTRCRRKDITDIFLGTGLGPRSYAIIEQGTISRLIESKPQELRVFIEEAAGISKYKERRRETENRIRHTRDNLDRLNDIREELDKQLNHLQRQAQAAEKYKKLRGEERRLRAQLAYLRWEALSQQLDMLSATIRELEVQYEAEVSRYRSIEAQLEQLRSEQTEANDALNEIQGRYYGIAAEIARLEQDIKHRAERKVQLQQDIARAQAALDNAAEHVTGDMAKAESLQAELMALEPEYEMAKARAESVNERLHEFEQQMQAWQARWDDFHRRAADIQRNAEIQKTRIQHLEAQQAQARERRSQWQKELDALASQQAIQDLSDLEVQLAELDERDSQLQAEEARLADAVASQRSERDAVSQSLQTLRSELAKHESQLAALQALQRAATTDSPDWQEALAELGLSDKPTLAEHIRVQPPWQSIVEGILGNRLLARVTDEKDSDWVKQCLAAGQPVVAVVKSEHDGHLSAPAPKGLRAIRDFVEGDSADWLSQIFVADNIDEAWSARTMLAPGQSIVTAEGLWLGRDWVQCIVTKNEEQSILRRQEEIERLSQVVEAQRQQEAELAETFSKLRVSLQDLEQNWQVCQKEQLALGKTRSEVQSAYERLKAKHQSVQERKARLEGDLAKLDEQISNADASLAEARRMLEQSVEAMAEIESERSALLTEREEIRTAMANLREQAKEEKEHAHRLALRVESLKTELNSTRQSHERAIHQQTEMRERLSVLMSALEENEAPVAEIQEILESHLKAHLEVEQQLKQARERVESADERLRSLEKERINIERSADDVRRQLENEKLRRENIRVQRENFAQKLSEYGVEPSKDAPPLPDEMTEADCEAKIARIVEQIERLGNINLAAIDEYQSQSERKQFLDQQVDDLNQALETLEEAIRKIDRETRSRFKETFEKINKGLQELFPKVFGGGHAYLELTGDDLLDTGVAIMARPPGKRNATIHLLSGGEKAMTAIALVFAIFRLNPAPFCMLDEVDAPLDDANVGRYCRLVKEMSEKIQFIYISHNKQAMEMADALLGVTMQEPGVSRMVSVDIEEATALAAS